GYYCEGGDSSEECPINHYCPPGSSSPHSCGAGGVSLIGSGSEFNCTCDSGYYGAAGANTCQSCPAGSYCNGGTHISSCPVDHYCPPGSSSPLPCDVNASTNTTTGSASSTDCLCNAGYYGSIGNNTCQSCPRGY